jgi:hypothetical protein
MAANPAFFIPKLWSFPNSPDRKPAPYFARRGKED